MRFIEGNLVKLKKNKLSDIEMKIIGVYHPFYQVEFVLDKRKKTKIFHIDSLEKC